MEKTKSFTISKHLIWTAWQKVQANQGAGGIDGQEIEDFEKDLKNNLYKIWNRMSSGSYMPTAKGVPQGSVIGPLLANLFLHYAFDEWMRRNHPGIPFERYADDCICHCRSLEQAEALRQAIEERFTSCKLELHPEKTKIVYCQRSGKQVKHDQTQFDFLGFTFRPRLAKSEKTGYFVSFLPAISNKAKKHIGEVIRRWNLHLWTSVDLAYIAKVINPKLQGWLNYYGKFYKTAMYPLFKRLNQRLARWFIQKFKKLRFHKRRAWHRLGQFASQHSNLFAHWHYGVRPRKSFD